MRIIPRSEWGARHGDGRWPRSLPAREAWLHHSVTVAPDLDPPRGDDYRAIRTIEQIGADRFGSVYGFPYTFGITPAGLIFEGHDVGNTGAHTKGHNTIGVGIVFVGNYENREPTGEQLDSCAWLLRTCEREGWLRDARLNGGHRDVSATACPGRHAYAQIDHINRRATGDFEEDDMSWGEDLALWAPGKHDPDNREEMTAGQQLNQARGYSHAAYVEVHEMRRMVEQIVGGRHAGAGVWRQNIPVPWGSDDNPEWYAQSILKGVYEHLLTVEENTVQILEAVQLATGTDLTEVVNKVREQIESVKVRLEVGTGEEEPNGS